MEKLAYPVSFSELQKRYEIKQSALSYRVKALGLKTQRRGRNTFFSVNQLSLLDKLDKFLKESPGETIDRFLETNTSETSPINHSNNNESLMNHPSIINTPMIQHQLNNDTLLTNQTTTGDSLMNTAIERIEQQISLLTKAVKQLQGGQLLTDESSIDRSSNKEDTDLEDEIEELEDELDELEEENQRLRDELEKAKKLCFDWQYSHGNLEKQKQILEQQITASKKEAVVWQNLWNRVLPSTIGYGDLIGANNAIYLKTNCADYNQVINEINAVLSFSNQQRR